MTNHEPTAAMTHAAWTFLNEVGSHGNQRPDKYIEYLSVWHSLDPTYSLAPGYPQRLRDHLDAELAAGAPIKMYR